MIIKIVAIIFLIYVFMCLLDLFSLVFPERKKTGELVKGLMDYGDKHLWFAPYPVKTKNGWKIFRYVHRKRMSDTNTCSETSSSWWVYY
jgi:hypothetical protein